MHDLILRDGWVIDGSGQARYRASVAIDGGTIVAVGDVPRGSGRREVDADGMTVAPGFIDLHTHSDFSLPGHPRADSMVRQGVTTQVLGNCGFSTFPVPQHRRALVESWSSFFGADSGWLRPTAAAYADFLGSLPLACNAALQVGHGTVRIAAMGFDDRAPSAAELSEMRALVTSALDDGAFAMSTGLIYAPSSYSRTDELIDLARTLTGYGAYYASHIRGEGETLIPAVTEALEIGSRAGVPVHLSHHKAQGRRHWGSVHQSLELVERAIADGRDVTVDVYPYAAGCTTLTAAMPPWALDGGIPVMLGSLRDPDVRARIARAMSPRGTPSGELAWQGFDVDTIMISSVPDGANKRYEHRMLSAVAAERAEEPVETALDLIEAEDGRVQIITFSLAEEDVEKVLTHPAAAIASDGWVLDSDAPGLPHPRNFGTFVRVLGAYVRERRLLSLPEAIRKMTSLPATRLGRADLGRVVVGCAADLVVFDDETVIDRATFEEPKQFCEGVVHVVVNGQPVIEDGRDTGASPGRVLRRGRP